VRFELLYRALWRVDMSRIISSGKSAANERKYRFIVELFIAGYGLDIGFNRRVLDFHKARHIQPQHGRSVVAKRGGEGCYRWCFSDLETAQSFAEEFKGMIIQK
jgi:hypothetical protein